MSEKLKTAIFQYAPAENYKDNIAYIEQEYNKIRHEKIDVIILPEYAVAWSDKDFSYSINKILEVQSMFIEDISKIAIKNNVNIVFGGVSSQDDKKFNSTYFVSNSGLVNKIYDKVHLYKAFGYDESLYLNAGNKNQEAIISINSWRLAFITCYDLRFAELAKIRALQGADVLIVLAQWTPGMNKIMHWRTLCVARAIENTVYVIGVGQAKPYGCGYSICVKPDGEIAEEIADESPSTKISVLEYSFIVGVRQIIPVLEQGVYL